MSRFPLALALVCLFLAPAQADPVDDLLAAAHAGDSATVSVQILKAADWTAQRDLVWALASTDPETVAFTQAWLATDGDDPLALTVRAWSIYWAAAQVRGERISVLTPAPLMAESQQMLGQALSLARQATARDAQFLPASDAVILISAKSGDPGGALEELDRIMALKPNRHSLVLTASALTPAWGGSLDLMQALCGHYAERVTEVADFGPDTCLAQAILRGQVGGEPRDWAVSVVVPQADKPFLERELMDLARDDLLPPEGADLLTTRLRSEGRVSAYVLLSLRPDALASPDLPKDLSEAIANDIAAAARVADRDPGFPTALQRLEDAMELEIRLIGSELQRNPEATDADRLRIANAIGKVRERNAAELDRRARRLLKIAPTNPAALRYASEHVIAPDPDPLKADQWALTVLTNAAVYSAYQEITVGQIAIQAETRYQRLRERMQSGEVPAYGADLLEETYLCPYVQAIRLIDDICAHHPISQSYCLSESIRMEPSPSTLTSTLYSSIAEQGACLAEREGPLEALRYTPVDLKF